MASASNIAMHALDRSRLMPLGLALTAAATLSVVVFADVAKGTATYTAKSGPVTVAFKHAYLMKGPDVVSGKVIRRVVLSVADVSKALAGCQSMMCSDGGIGDGMTIDFDGPRLNYWFVAKDQLVQHSGTAAPAAAKLTTDTPTRVAGTLSLDGSGGGPKVQVEFDAALVKELKK
jgi:hypothetical protein